MRVDAAECRAALGDAARACYVRAYSRALEGRSDPRPAVDAITAAVRRAGGDALSECHGVMHTVGRTWARSAGVSLAALMDVLPRSNDPGCPAGFAHGVVTQVAGSATPAEAASVCASSETRYRRYSCIHGFGHAFMRVNGDRLEPALELCRALGDEAPDCAQGAYHDYWFAVVGADDAALSTEPVRDPRRLCGAAAAEFVRPCWYRAFLENRPKGFVLETADDLEGLCGGLRGLQRSACVTGASLIGPADPLAQLALCGDLPQPADAVACLRGVKAQNVDERSFEGLIRGCSLVVAARPQCHRWLGKVLAVLTDGRFDCSPLPRAARRACASGARSLDGPLVTFS